MRSLIILAAVFGLGIFLGHDFWPQSAQDPTFHLRFHRGRLPAQTVAPEPHLAPNHGRILPTPTPSPKAPSTFTQPNP